jgi:hypothetical protein
VALGRGRGRRRYPGRQRSIIGDTGTVPGLRTRSALAMIEARLNGSDGLGAPGFTAQTMRNLLYSDIQYGATLVKSQLVSMCRSFPGGRVPTSTGTSRRATRAPRWGGPADPA